jgi:hypothetical protein
MGTTSPIIPQQPMVGWTAPQQWTPTPASQWQPPSQWQQIYHWPAPPPQAPSEPHPSQLFATARVHLVGLVAALVLQATIALVASLPEPPGAFDFWARFALLELAVAVVLAFTHGPGVSVRALHPAAVAVLALAFVVVPAAAITVGAIDALHEADLASRAAALPDVTQTLDWTGVLAEVDLSGRAVGLSTAIETVFLTIVFFGLPLIALVAPRRDAPVEDPGETITDGDDGHDD